MKVEEKDQVINGQQYIMWNITFGPAKGCLSCVVLVYILGVLCANFRGSHVQILGVRVQILESCVHIFRVLCVNFRSLCLNFRGPVILGVLCLNFRGPDRKGTIVVCHK